MIKIIIGADIVPTESNYNLFFKNDINQLIGNDLIEILRDVDFSLFNLEVPLTDKKTPIEKCGPNLIAPTSTIEGIKEINPYFFTLANNHILDQGEKGLFSTMDLLDKHGIAYAGAGKNIKEARKPYIFEKNGKKIGIYCCAEHEFSIATDTKPGANLFDPFESLDDINTLKSECDYVIVLYHGGKEHYRYPSPYLQKVCRKIVEKGADLVVCQHSHCIGCKEDWKDGTIVYGQGNFLFDYSESEFWKTSLLISLCFEKGYKKPILEFIPIHKNKNKVEMASNEDKEEILQNFYRRTEEIKNEGFIEKKYKDFAEEMQSVYLNSFMGSISKNIFYRALNKLTRNHFQNHILKMIYNKKNRLMIQNFIECEAHRELIIKGIK